MSVEFSSVDYRHANGLRALQNISCRFAPQSFSVIVGASGSGKSTLLRLAAGLVQPTSGQINKASSLETGFVFQDPTLLLWRNVYDNVALPLHLRGLTKSECDARVHEALARVGLEARADALPRELSGGQRMRVSLARALAGRPQILLLDEPFAALDEHIRMRLEEDLLSLWKTIGCTIIFVTHSVSEAVFLGERVLVLGADGTMQKTIAMPARTENFRETKEFFTACADLRATLKAGAK